MNGAFPAFVALVALNLKLSLRGLSDLLEPRSARRKALILLAALALLHGLAWLIVAALILPNDAGLGAQGLAVVTRSALLFVTPWTIASAMTATTRLFHLRGDLDLILASPISPRAVVAARLLYEALESVAPVGLILLPFADVGALTGHMSWLALYPALAGAGLLGAGVGFLLALRLYFWLGPRNARVVSQIVSTLVGASAVIAAQAIAAMPEGWRTRIYEFVAAPAAGALGRLFATPQQAALGDPRALTVWLALALAAFAAAALIGGESFVTAAGAAAGAAAKPTDPQQRAHFRAKLGAAMRVKEHRLLRRDPWLLSQMMLQALYALPVGVVLWRHGGASSAPAIAFGPMLVVITGQLAGSLAWVALSAEDAPDFLATAPASRGEINRAKLAAILRPVALAMALPLLGLAWLTPWGALCALFGGGGAAASGALLMLWRQRPARRSLVLRRHSQSKLLALGEHWLSLLWASATAIAAFGSAACLAPVALAAMTLWLISRGGRQLDGLATA